MKIMLESSDRIVEVIAGGDGVPGGDAGQVYFVFRPGGFGTALAEDA